ncbi:MAG: ABC transporter substrate-binding protein [Actinomycetaceae bacterium]|nr:ABC transporter substrate-binding protein [Actinomycetaceae bacterium]MDY6083575.1 ABC transporter substrate-binding protein [Actinomycetaceae bacterium]
MKHRVIAGMGALVLSVAALAGCAGTGSASSSGSSSDPNAKVQLDFWTNHPGNSTATEKQLIAQFEKENPNVTVKLTDGGADYPAVAQKFNAALAGGQIPDVVVVADVTWFNFALNGQLLALDQPLKDAGVDVGNYVSAFYDDYKMGESHYAVPYARSTPLFYYNAEVWKKAGLPDRAPETWDEFEQWAPKIVAANGGKPALAMPMGSDYAAWYWQNMLWAQGAAISDGWTSQLTSEPTVKAAQWLQNMVKKGYIAVGKTSSETFAAGQAASMLQSTGSLAEVSESAKGFTVRTGFLPGYAKNSVPTGGAGVAIPAKISKDHVQAAVKFAAFLGGNKGTVQFSQATGYLPASTGALDQPEFKKFVDENPNFKTAADQLKYTHPQDNYRVLVPGGDVKIGAALDSIFNGGDVAAQLKSASDQLTQAYNDQIKPKLDAAK